LVQYNKIFKCYKKDNYFIDLTPGMLPRGHHGAWPILILILILTHSHSHSHSLFPYLHPMASWQQRDEQSIWHPFSPLKGSIPHLPVVAASGPYLITEDGRHILDAVSSWWVNLHGHSHPLIAGAIARQASNLEHVMFAGFTHEPAITLAESLLDILPENQARIFYSDNGSTAVEVAIKLSIQYWYNRDADRNRVIAIDGAYHGDTFGSMSVGERSIFTKPFYPFLFNVEFIPFPTRENETDVMEQFRTLIDAGEVATFIFEPLIQGASGMRMYRAEFLDELIHYARTHGVLCVADEVMTGFGRTGKMFASDYLANKPDMICLSKGLTGGALPLGATSISLDVVEAFQTPDLEKAFLHGHSYTANPIACAAANASLELLIATECQGHISRITEKHKDFVSRHTGHPKLRNLRFLGTILAVEFHTDADSSYTSELRNRLYPFFLERNILLRPLGNLIYVLPPYVMTDEQLETVYQAIEEFLALS
jgi:adenosylmethionine---8-amino-7-oxononanoate aminotransferase